VSVETLAVSHLPFVVQRVGVLGTFCVSVETIAVSHLPFVVQRVTRYEAATRATWRQLQNTFSHVFFTFFQSFSHFGAVPVGRQFVQSEEFSNSQRSICSGMCFTLIQDEPKNIAILFNCAQIFKTLQLICMIFGTNQKISK